MVLPYEKWARSIILLALSQFMLASTAVADTRTTDDYIAITVEAEDHSTRDDRWILTDPSTPAQDNDPDPNHSDGAVGNAYLELLPDIRVTHDDEFGPPTAMWHQPGTGPRASYPLNFPEAGRYYVHIRAYSTGTEDNGIHVGLNGDFPLSGARLQFCTAGQGWAWSSRQRYAGGVGPCGVPKTVWITVEEPGMNTFMISAREDGFEADRIMLIKDLSDNTRICSPTGANDISCVNGTLENVDDVVDMDVEIETETTTASIDEEVSFAVVVRNRDGYDTAEDVVLSLDLGLATQWDAVDVAEGCDIEGTSIVCELGPLAPTAPEYERIFDFTLQPLRTGTLSIPAAIDTSSVDDKQDNDEKSVDIDVTDEGTLSQLTATWTPPATPWEVATESVLRATIASTGVADAEQATVSVSIPSGLDVTALPESCAGIRAIRCSFDILAMNDQVVLDFGITPSAAGIYSATVTATAANLDGDDITESYIIEAAAEVTSEPAPEAPVEPTVEMPASGQATAGESSSGSVGLWMFMLLAMTLVTRSYLVSRTRRLSLAKH